MAGSAEFHQLLPILSKVQGYSDTQTCCENKLLEGNQECGKKPCHVFARVFVCTKLNQGLEVTKRQGNAKL